MMEVVTAARDLCMVSCCLVPGGLFTLAWTFKLLTAKVR